MAITLAELDDRVTYVQQLQEETGPVVLINTFTVAPEDAERLLAVWAEDAAFMKHQPGFIATQLHRGIAGSTASRRWRSRGSASPSPVCTSLTTGSGLPNARTTASGPPTRRVTARLRRSPRSNRGTGCHPPR